MCSLKEREHIRRIEGFHLRNRARRIALSLCDSHSWLEPGHHAVVVHVAPALPLFGCESHGHPQISRCIAPSLSAKRKFKSLRHYADNSVGLTVELDRS